MCKIKFLIILFLCGSNLYYEVHSAFVLNHRLKPRNPNVTSEIVEGDILVFKNNKTEKTFTEYINNVIKFPSLNQTNKLIQFAASIHNLDLWTDGVVPYELSSELNEHKCLIESAMLHIMMQSCIFFRPKQDSDSHFIWIYKDNGCFASVGRDPERNRVSLGDGCYHFGTIIHELMHVLGFHHEHARFDRNKYLKIHYANISDLKELRSSFNAKSEHEERIFTDFDFDSILMYGPTDFGIDGKVTVESLLPGKSLGQRMGLSPLDVQSINLLYTCGSVNNLVCTKLAQTLDHMKRCECSFRKKVNLNLLKIVYQSCKKVMKS